MSNLSLSQYEDAPVLSRVSDTNFRLIVKILRGSQKKEDFKVIQFLSHQEVQNKLVLGASSVTELFPETTAYWSNECTE